MSSGKERKISENVVPLAQAATIVARAGRTADGRYLRSGAEREKKRRKMLQVASSLFFFFGRGEICSVCSASRVPSSEAMDLFFLLPFGPTFHPSTSLPLLSCPYSSKCRSSFSCYSNNLFRFLFFFSFKVLELFLTRWPLHSSIGSL